MAVQGAIATLRTFYVKERLEESFGHFLNQDENSTCSSNSNISDPLEKEIQSQTSFWIMWISILSAFPPIFTATFLVASSDSIGRKPILIFSGVCHLIASVIFLLVASFDLPLYVFVLGASVLGLCGDREAVSMVSSAYIADSTEGKSRTQRMAIQSFMGTSGFGTGQPLSLDAITLASEVFRHQLASAVGLLRTMPQPICKNIISKQVGTKEQGAVFAMVTVARLFLLPVPSSYKDSSYTL
ncbi:proton-coupled folate transporter-like [Diadema antillarum]|uniref:proton-coupled folate transporter-like n=1 Tax=Diadema antillarum TaxID=105358 RepID=UPI003A87A28B